MAILNPEHLFEQAEALIVPPPAGPPRQVNVRRAISAAYYGVFHAILTAAADQFVGVSKRTTSRYALVYRSVDHGRLRTVCEEVNRPIPSSKYARHVPSNGFGGDIVAFVASTIELQQKRNAADYDPLIRVKSSDATTAIAFARGAVRRFNAADPGQRETFLSLLLFPPR